MYSIEQVKAIGKERSVESFSRLLEIFGYDVSVDIKREAVSSIGRHSDNDRVYEFVRREAFNSANPMELIYQMFRTCLYKSNEDSRLLLGCDYRDEVVNAINASFFDFSLQFFREIVEAKLSGHAVNMSWYREHFIEAVARPSCQNWKRDKVYKM